MLSGAHVLCYSRNPEADRAFFRDALGFRFVDAGGGWLIFALPAAEAAFHPLEGDAAAAQHGEGLLGAELYLMCDDLSAELQKLAAKSVSCATPTEAPWGLVTTVPLPSGGAVGLYQPRHPTALGL